MKIRSNTIKKANIPMPKQNKIKKSVDKPKGAYKNFA
jgi:hypothetical protein